jgi:hypothetical protein
MTDDPRSPLPDSAPDELDLLASRVLDGDVDPAERARAEADPAVSARLAALSRVRAEMRDLPALDPTITADAVAAALAVFDEQHRSAAAAAGGAGTVVTPPLAPVVPLRRRTGWSNALPWLGAAAAAAALVVGVASIGSRDGDDMAVSPSADNSSADTFALPSDGAAPEAASGADDDMTTMTAKDGESETMGDTPVDDSGRIGEDSSDSVVAMSATDAPAATEAPTEAGAPAETAAPTPPDEEMTVAGGMPEVTDAAALSRLAETATPLDDAPICAPDATLLVTDVLYGDDPTSAVVVEVVRDESGDIVAYDVTTCSETARVPRG